MESLTPQLISAGRIRLTYAGSKAAEEHFDNLVAQYAESMQRARALCDEATPSADFIRVSGTSCRWICECVALISVVLSCVVSFCVVSFCVVGFVSALRWSVPCCPVSCLMCRVISCHIYHDVS